MAITEATAKAVREREGNRCQLCNLHEFEQGWGKFELHHTRPKRMGGTTEADRDHPDRLALLHQECHSEVHANPRQAREVGLLESRLGTIRPSALIRRPA